MLILISNLSIPADNQAEFLRLAETHIGSSREEAGCISHELFRSTESANGFFFFERWQNQAALDAHFQKSYSQHFAGQVARLAEGKPSITIYQTAGERTIP